MTAVCQIDSHLPSTLFWLASASAFRKLLICNTESLTAQSCGTGMRRALSITTRTYPICLISAFPVKSEIYFALTTDYPPAHPRRPSA